MHPVFTADGTATGNTTAAGTRVDTGGNILDGNVSGCRSELPSATTEKRNEERAGPKQIIRVGGVDLDLDPICNHNCTFVTAAGIEWI